MKLYKLLEAHTTRISRSKSGGENSEAEQDALRNQLKSHPSRIGSGAEAIVFARSSSPGVVTKIHQGGRAMADYLTACNTDPYIGNPFLPNVYKIVEIRENVYKFEMEQLFKLKINSEEEMEMYISQWADDSDHFKKIIQQTGWNSPLSTHGLSEAIEETILVPKLHNILTDSGKQAAQLILKAVSGMGVSVDIHSENIMVRRTSVGPQLVITDPLHTGSYF